MAFLGNFMAATGNAWSAFRETLLNADPQSGRAGTAFDPGSWDRWESRQVRYDIYWGLYSNDVYRDLVHPWSPRYKASYGLYKHTRSIYNPAYRLGELWTGHLMGGLLDPGAGDGDEVPSALPILTDHAAIRPGLAQLWHDSTWQVYKDLYSLWGSVLGDVGLKGVADTARGQVRIEVVHPGHLKWVDRDECGEVTGYILQKWVTDPRDSGVRDASPTLDPSSSLKRVIYYEKCYLDGKRTVYETYLDGEPWGEKKWDRPYGFVPLELASHQNVGLDWGQNCFHAGLSRFREVDDQASCLGDQNRRLLRAPKLIAGSKGPDSLKAGTDRASRSPEQNLADPEPGRAEQIHIYIPSSDVKVFPLYAENMDTRGTLDHIREMLADTEAMYPELLADTGNLGGNVTAEAIRNARQRAAGRVQARRPGYEDRLCRMQKKLLVMGSLEKFDGYAGYTPAAYESGGLDHSIGHRPVFDVEPMDRLEEDAALWKNAIAAKTAGVPLAVFLADNGWDEARLAALKAAQALEPVPTTTINLGQTGQVPQDTGQVI